MASKLNGQHTLFFPIEIYSVEAVDLAAYIYEDKIVFSLEKKDKGTEVCFDANTAESLIGDFENEVLNQQCRIDLAKKNSDITNLIVAKSLLSAIGGASNE